MRNQKGNSSFFATLDRFFLLDEKDFGELKKMTKSEEEAFWNEKEWTIGKILKRLFAYSFTLLWFFIGVCILFSEDILGVLFGLSQIYLGFRIFFTYIRADIQILREKRRRRKLGSS